MLADLSFYFSDDMPLLEILSLTYDEALYTRLSKTSAVYLSMREEVIVMKEDSTLDPLLALAT